LTGRRDLNGSTIVRGRLTYRSNEVVEPFQEPGKNAESVRQKKKGLKQTFEGGDGYRIELIGKMIADLRN
jgi:hypothetical protein